MLRCRAWVCRLCFLVVVLVDFGVWGFVICVLWIWVWVCLLRVVVIAASVLFVLVSGSLMLFIRVCFVLGF